MASRNIAFRIETLITEVKKRRALYDYTTEEYNNRNLRKALWVEVCRAIYTSAVWDAFSPEEKYCAEKEVNKKWTSLRDCFRREVKINEEAKLNKHSKRKRKYVYYDALKFLLLDSNSTKTDLTDYFENFNDNTDIPDNSYFENEEEEKVDGSRGTKSECDDYDDHLEVSFDEAELIPQSRGKKKRRSYDTAQNTLLVSSADPLSQGRRFGDDDEAFLMSLVPTMKDFSNDEKILLRIELMKTIVQFKKNAGKGSSSRAFTLDSFVD